MKSFRGSRLTSNNALLALSWKLWLQFTAVLGRTEAEGAQKEILVADLNGD